MTNELEVMSLSAVSVILEAEDKFIHRMIDVKTISFRTSVHAAYSVIVKVHLSSSSHAYRIHALVISGRDCWQRETKQQYISSVTYIAHAAGIGASIGD